MRVETENVSVFSQDVCFSECGVCSVNDIIDRLSPLTSHFSPAQQIYLTLLFPSRPAVPIFFRLPLLCLLELIPSASEKRFLFI